MDAKTSETMAQDGAQPSQKRTRRREGWRGYALGKLLLTLWNRIIFQREKDAERKKAEIRRKLAALQGIDKIVGGNFERLCSDYIGMSNAYGLFRATFMSEAHILLIYAEAHYLDKFSALTDKEPTGYANTRDIFKGWLKTKTPSAVYDRAVKELEKAVAVHFLAELYSKEFTGCSTLLAFPSDERDMIYSEYVELMKVMEASPSVFDGVKPLAWKSILPSKEKLAAVADELAAYDMTEPRAFFFMPLIDRLTEGK